MNYFLFGNGHASEEFHKKWTHSIEKAGTVNAKQLKEFASEQKEAIVSKGIKAFMDIEDLSVGSGTQVFGNAAVVQIHGEIFPTHSLYTYFYGGVSTRQVGEIVSSLDAEDGVDVIVLDIDSGGGSVNGTQALVNIIRNCNTKVVAYVRGMAASAAYWIASAADEIYAESDTSMFGSIGVMTVHQDLSEYLAQNGVAITLLTASQSTDKVVGSPYSPLTDEDANKIRQDLTEIADIFLKDVKKGRGTKIKIEGRVKSADVVLGKEAVKIGLADKVLNKPIGYAIRKSVTGKFSNKNKAEMNNFLKSLAVNMPNIMTLQKSSSAVLISTEDYARINAVLDGLDPETIESTEYKGAAFLSENSEIKSAIAGFANMLSGAKGSVLVDGNKLQGLSNFMEAAAKEETNALETAETLIETAKKVEGEEVEETVEVEAAEEVTETETVETVEEPVEEIAESETVETSETVEETVEEVVEASEVETVETVVETVEAPSPIAPTPEPVTASVNANPINAEIAELKRQMAEQAKQLQAAIDLNAASVKANRFKKEPVKVEVPNPKVGETTVSSKPSGGLQLAVYNFQNASRIVEDEAMLNQEQKQVVV